MREDWTTVYETHNRLDADAVRATLEGAGFPVVERGDFSGQFPSPSGGGQGGGVVIALAVPPGDADDARAVLRDQRQQSGNRPGGGEGPISVRDAADDVMALRQGHTIAGCKYCGIPTLDVREDELQSQQVALLRAAGLGANSASFSDFAPGERICTECAAHEVECDICGREMDGFLDSGIYRRVNADEAYICTTCAGRLDDALETTRDW